MPDQGLLSELSRFFNAARHLWGRCPHCDELFRLSDVAISADREPPRDWLRRFQKRETALRKGEDRLVEWQSDLEGNEQEIEDRERDVFRRERNVEALVRTRAKELARDERTIRDAMRDARAQALQRSRTTRLGKFFERLWPFRQQLGHDPRDMRVILDPIDYVVFHGLTEHRHVERITFIEVKSGGGRATPCQNSIAAAVREKRLDFQVCQIDPP